MDFLLATLELEISVELQNSKLHNPFVSGAASPRNIEILMNVEGLNRKHIASHLQV